MKLCAEDFRGVAKNTLKGFFTLVLPEVGIRIKECAWHEKNGRQWVAFPAHQYSTKEGELKWQPLVEFVQSGSRELRNAFQDAAIAAVKRIAGGAADNGTSPPTALTTIPPASRRRRRSQPLWPPRSPSTTPSRFSDHARQATRRRGGRPNRSWKNAPEPRRGYEPDWQPLQAEKR